MGRYVRTCKSQGTGGTMKKLLVLFRLVALAVTAAQEDEQDTVKRYAKSRDHIQ